MLALILKNLKIFTIWLAILILSLGIWPINIFAQQARNNPIDLGIWYINDGNNKTWENKKIAPNSWEQTDVELTPESSIRYAWSGTELDLKYKNAPVDRGGYLKIYLSDDSKPENLLIEYGASPLPINKIQERLSGGENKLLFVYIDKTGQTTVPETKVLFTFKYRSTVVKPSLNLLEPIENTILMKDDDRAFKLELQNFSLESADSKSPNKGQIRVYFDEVKDTNRLLTLRSCKDLGGNKCLAEFTTKDLDFEKNIPDSKETKFIFVPTKSDETALDFPIERKFTTNFGNSLNVGLPRITIIEPNKNRTDLSVDGDRQFSLKIENFEVLAELSSGDNEFGKGYLQIFVDNNPTKRIWPRSNFSLNEIGEAEEKEGQKTVSVQLVNKDFTKLKPEAKDSVSIVYTPKNTEEQTANTDKEPQLENNSWRVIIVSLIVILVIGGIAVLITRG